MQLDFIPGFESREQMDIASTVRRIGSEPESLGYALKHAGCDLLTNLADDLLGIDDPAVRLALSVFLTNYVRLECH